MKVQALRPLSALSIAATIAFAAFAASAQTTPMMGGEMKGKDMMKGGDMMGGDMTRMTQMQAIKAALDPLYASFSDEQKKLADGLKIGPMGVM